MKKLLAALALVLSACGGGGSGPAPIQAVQVTPLPFIAIDGDSLADTQKSLWPSLLASSLPADYRNIALAGSMSYRPLGNFDAAFGDRKGVYILIVGTNDLALGLSGIPEVMFNLRTTWAKAKARGDYVVASTIANGRAFQGNDDATALAFRTELNAQIRASSGSYDALLELDKLLPDQDDTTVYVDGVHFTDAGSQIVAQAIYRAVTSR